MNEIDQAKRFHNLHVRGEPLILYNVWDAGTARTVAEAGAPAIATGSWSVAAAQGYPDGQVIPFESLLEVVTRIAQTVDIPVSVDFEGGYAKAPEALRTNASRLMEAGAIGVNFEDQVVGEAGLYEIKEQVGRIAALRSAADERKVSLFINARTDLFLKESNPDRHLKLIPEAKDRAAAYREAGASGFFVPGLLAPDAIGQICEATALPVNTMMMRGSVPVSELAKLGVARVSYGPGPYIEAHQRLAQAFRQASGLAASN